MLKLLGRLKRDYTAYRQRLQDEAKRERNAYQQRIQDLELEMRKKIDAQLAEERRRLEEQSQSEDGATVC